MQSNLKNQKTKSKKRFDNIEQFEISEQSQLLLEEENEKPNSGNN